MLQDPHLRAPSSNGQSVAVRRCSFSEDTDFSHENKENVNTLEVPDSDFTSQKIHYSFCDPCNPVDQDLLFLSIRDLPLSSASPSMSRSAPSSKCPSAPHSRANSVKVRRPKRDPELETAQFRPRTSSMTSSMPGTDNPPVDKPGLARKFSDEGSDAASDHYRTVRRFTISSRGIKNRGDSIKRKSKSSTSVASNSSNSNSDSNAECQNRKESVVSTSTNNADEEGTTVLRYTVLMLGSPGVGRTALVEQFMTSEYLGGRDYDEGEESTERSISVLLDGEESELSFIDVEPGEDKEYHHTADAFIMTYSVLDKRTFKDAAKMLSQLTKRFQVHRAMILVGNKSDVVRTREVSENDGKKLATAYGCKFIETSAVLNHQIDELLVGVLRQIRLIDEKKPRRRLQGRVSRVTRELVNKIFKKRRGGSLSKSCENLYVL